MYVIFKFVKRPLFDWIPHVCLNFFFFYQIRRNHVLRAKISWPNRVKMLWMTAATE
jgi:hypothetical protein